MSFTNGTFKVDLILLAVLAVTNGKVSVAAYSIQCQAIYQFNTPKVEPVSRPGREFKKKRNGNIAVYCLFL